MKIKAINLAEFILISYPDKYISPMKLQKLAFYTKVWSLVSGNNFVNADFERWDYGPVNSDIFHQYRAYSRSSIPVPKNKNVKIDHSQKEFIKFVIDNYIDQSAVALSIRTHNEDPWKNTNKNEVISDESIKEYYSKQTFAKNFQGKSFKEGPFYILKTNAWHSFTMDMDKKEAIEYEVYPSYNEFVQRTQIAKKQFNKFISENF